MSNDEVIAMAREAGFLSGEMHMSEGTESRPFVRPVSTSGCLVELANFARLVAAREREACALACEAGIDQGRETALESKSRSLAGGEGEIEALKFWSAVNLHNTTSAACAAAIRARSAE